MRARALAAALAVLIAAAFLAACGGGGGGDSSATAASASTPTTTTSSPPAPRPRSPQSAAKTRAERRLAGRAAPFVIAEADNSVPTFGSEAGAGERTEAEATLRAYLRARAREDWSGACRLLAKGVREGYEKLAASSSKGAKPSCAEVLPALSKGADLSDPLSGHLLSLRVHGQNAFALFYGPGHQRYMVPMNREAGQWRPTQAAPIAYPPGATG
jgi:hypothetical protein